MDGSEPRRVLVIGGSRGIGEAVAAAFIAAGDQVIVAARHADVSEAASRIGASSVVCDVADPASVERTIEACAPIDVVVNAAAIQGGSGAIGPLWDTDPASVARVFEINLLGSYHVLRSALRHMRERHRGSVILFSGGGSTAARPGLDAYGASKTAVLRLAESAQLALDEEGIPVRVFAIAPGAVATAMTREMLENIARVPRERDATHGIAEGRAGVPPTLAAELCVFLAGPDSTPLAGRLVHVRESYRDYVTRALGDDAGRLRRADYPPH